MDEPISGPRGAITYKLENKNPVALDDLTASLAAFGQSYEDFLLASGEVTAADGVKLYIRELRTGSIIADLQALATQGQLIFDTLKDAYEHRATLAGFVTHLAEISQFFLGLKSLEPAPSKKEAEQTIRMFEPVAKDSASQLAIQYNGDVNIGTVNIYVDSQKANAIQNGARRHLGPTLPDNRRLTDEVMTLHQVRGVATQQAGDRGIIEGVSKSPVKLVYASDSIKKAILEQHDNLFHLAFLVDVDVKTVDEKPALYKILALKDTFEKP